MKKIEITVPPHADGQRADVFLSEAIPGMTRSAAQRLMNGGKVKTVGSAHTRKPLKRLDPNFNFESRECAIQDKVLRGVGGTRPAKPVPRERQAARPVSEANERAFSKVSPKKSFDLIPKNHRVKAGETLMCEIPAPVPMEAKAEEIEIEIVYEDADLVVVNKPRGMVVHPAAGHSGGTLVNALLYRCELSGIGGVLRPGIVHRLDKDTSGLMVVAKNDAAHQGLAAQLAGREMGRKYFAVCVGNVKEDRLRIDLPIGRHLKDRKKMAVNVPRAREAATNIEVLERLKGHVLVAARLETGRTHQIRVHMANRGNPVLGDVVYGAARQNFGGQMLHAGELKLVHPLTGEVMEFFAPLPEYFVEVLRKIGARYGQG